MSHNHSHAPANYGRAFAIGIVLNTVYVAHLMKSQGTNEDDLLCRLRTELHDRFGIEHTTIQIVRSPATTACTLANRPDPQTN